ncbi:hypothetical protein [Stenotrophomonas humi]
METYEATPHKGIGPVLLGMTRDAVHLALGNSFTSFRKAPSSAHPTDAWHKAAFQVFYEGLAPTVEYIELSRDGDFSVNVMGRSVFDTPAAELISLIEAVTASDKSDPERGFSYVFPELDLSLWRPSLADQRFATIGIGRPGYYGIAA